MPESQKPRLLLIDGNNLVHRAFHALPPLTVRRTGELVNAVYGFSSMLLKVLADQKPTHYAVAFDKKGPTFRHDMFEDYKANRPSTPDELVGQLSRTRELVKDFNIPVYEMDGFEADDMLGALSHQAAQQGIETVILTGDADAMQLVGPHVRVLYPKTMGEAVLMDAEKVKEKYLVPPEMIADLKALKGDPSDNIPGVKGIGEKTAAKLIQQFGGVEDIYNHIDEVTPPRIQDLLRQNEAVARQSKALATIDVKAPVTLDLEGCRVKNFDREKVVALFRDLEFFKLIDRLPLAQSATSGVQGTLMGEAPAAPTPRAEEKKEYRTVITRGELEALAGRLNETKNFAFDVVARAGNPMNAQLVGIAISPSFGEAYYIPLTHAGLEAGPQLAPDEVKRALSPVFENLKIEKSAHNANFATSLLYEYGIDSRRVSFDTMLAAHLLGEQSLELKSLALGRLGVELPVLPTGSGAKQIPVSHLSVQAVSDYACACADAISRLSVTLTAELEKQGLFSLFEDLEMPLVPVLVRMQRNGVMLDSKLLEDMSSRLGDRLTALESEIYKCVGHQFNINSPKQLGPVLFEELHLPTEQKKKGSWSTEAAVLEALRGAHPVVDFILEYRQLNKLKSTYIDALPGLVNPRSGRVHTSFNQMRTATGRLSSSDPNLQNIPVRGELGREIRRAFIAPPGHVLLSGDYSQIDLRALAHLSQDALLLSTFERGEDIHTATAAQLFGVDSKAVTADMRRLAKTVNFGVIYGMSGYGLEQATEFSREEAERFIAAYFDKYPGVRRYLDDTKMDARRQGYVETVLGRRRYIPEINSANRMIREAAERMAINMPVQGTSADIIKVAMLNLEEEMDFRKLASKLILQVHDELIFEVPEGEVAVMQEIVPRLMGCAIQLAVPVKVDVKIGCTWGQME
ncbi:MAG: DNA polymerase I [Dehalococcoidia bacterium]|nr:MAG: DNA polymerase I [Dehalococcoidia bacterium]